MITRQPLSVYQQHVARWRGCTLCSLHEGRTNVVLARGRVPADVVFVGEAPGYSEDSLGTPFAEGAPAGALLERIIARTGLTERYSYALTNVVACIPRGEDGDKVSQPPDDAMRACRPRLEEFVNLCSPKLIVCVGEVAQSWLRPGYKHSPKFKVTPKFVDILHPAYILRKTVAERGFLVQKTVVALTTALEDL